MNPQEKANELVDRMLNEQSFSNELYDAKQCALIAVDEIIKSHLNLYGVNNKAVKFYLHVKEEIEKL